MKPSLRVPCFPGKSKDPVQDIVININFPVKITKSNQVIGTLEVNKEIDAGDVQVVINGQVCSSGSFEGNQVRFSMPSANPRSVLLPIDDYNIASGDIIFSAEQTFVVESIEINIV